MSSSNRSNKKVNQLVNCIISFLKLKLLGVFFLQRLWQFLRQMFVVSQCSVTELKKH